MSYENKLRQYAASDKDFDSDEPTGTPKGAMIASGHKKRTQLMIA
jgi:hypothetical protein